MVNPFTIFVEDRMRLSIVQVNLTLLSVFTIFVEDKIAKVD